MDLNLASVYSFLFDHRSALWYWKVREVKKQDQIFFFLFQYSIIKADFLLSFEYYSIFHSKIWEEFILRFCHKIFFSIMGFISRVFLKLSNYSFFHISLELLFRWKTFQSFSCPNSPFWTCLSSLAQYQVGLLLNKDQLADKDFFQ